MEQKIKKGTVVLNKVTSSKHVVDSIDYYDDVILVFTEDKQYIKIEDVLFDNDNFLIQSNIDEIFENNISDRDSKFLDWVNSLN
jgi:hypothetical protein